MPADTPSPIFSEMAATQRWRHVADLIVQDVQSGFFGPGAWLRQIELERRYVCNRGDVRRALDELVARRLVQHIPNRGFHVFELAPDRIAHLMQLRAILEGSVADLIYNRAEAADRAELAALAADFETQVASGTPLQRNAANLAFHMRLLDLCPNPELAQMARDVRRRLPSALVYQWPTPGWIEQSVRDHARMLAALRERNQQKLRQAMVGHLRLEQRVQEWLGKAESA